MPQDLVKNRNRDPQPTGNRGAHRIELPMVIRPVVPHLVDVERRLRTDAGFARELAMRPELFGTLARAIMHRDPNARARFADASALAEHLRAVRAG